VDACFHNAHLHQLYTYSIYLIGCRRISASLSRPICLPCHTTSRRIWPWHSMSLRVVSSWNCWTRRDKSSMWPKLPKSISNPNSNNNNSSNNPTNYVPWMRRLLYLFLLPLPLPLPHSSLLTLTPLVSTIWMVQNQMAPRSPAPLSLPKPRVKSTILTAPYAHRVSSRRILASDSYS